jgi:hypothetical protein
MKLTLLLLLLATSTLGFAQGSTSIIRARPSAPGTCSNTLGSVYWDSVLIRLGACRATNVFDYMPWLSSNNPWSGFQDFSNATMSLPVSGGLTETTDGMVGFDTTNKNYHVSVNGVDNVIPTVLPATPVNGHCPKWLVSSGNIKLGDAGTSCGDFPDVKIVPAANCNNAAPGAGWDIPATGAPTVNCQTGSTSAHVSGLLTFTDGNFAYFDLYIPEDWDNTVNPYVRAYVVSSDTTSGHTIIPQVAISCGKGDGSTTDDVAFNAAHSLSTITTNTTANQFWSTSSVQLNSTDMTGCVAGAIMHVQVGRATDSNANASYYAMSVTFPRLMTLQAD